MPDFGKIKKVKGGSYGRAAKLIAIYLKSMIVVQNNTNSLAEIVHPPIDSLILKKISGDESLNHPRRAYWKNIKWTLLDEKNYKQLIMEFRQVYEGRPLWHIEEYWTIEDN